MSVTPPTVPQRFTIPIVLWLEKSKVQEPMDDHQRPKKLTFQSYVESVLSEKGLKLGVQTLRGGRIERLLAEHTISGQSQPLESEFPKAVADDSSDSSKPY